jgi:hypothetical protein
MTAPFTGEGPDPMKIEMLEGMMATETPEPPTPNELVEPNKPEPEEATATERRHAMYRAMFGDSFPGADTATEKDNEAWVRWGYDLWTSRGSAVRQRLWAAQRNRLMRAGHQWIDSSGPGEAWVEPPRPRDALRLVYNMIDKALDQRLQIIADQQPGFTMAPATMDSDDKRAAQARQMACEHQFRQCHMREKVREAEYWAQTDGVAFWQAYWDPTRGPWDNAMAVRERLGDFNCRTLRIEQVRVSANATATEPPMWVVVRDLISKAEATARYGYAGTQASATGDGTEWANNQDDMGAADYMALRHSTPGEGDRLRDVDAVPRLHIYLAPTTELPDGLELTIVGRQVVYGPAPLLFGIIPIIRVSDGSTDPSYYPVPTMEQWIDSQVRMNMLLSKWGENIRVNSGGRLLARTGAITEETWFGGLTNLIEVKGVGAFDDIIKPIPGFSVGADVKEAFILEKTAFEDASGWNAVSRGQVTGESGRAIIASREQLERVFAPPVHALALALTEWARVAIRVMQWGYVVPRAMGVVGRSRPDLARALTGDMLDTDGASDVFVEPATMMPMPLSFRLYMLDNWLASGVIDMAEYRRRQKFAVVSDIATPDEDQEARAQRKVDALLNGEEIPEMRWQDNEAIHQDVLEREVLLRDDLDPEIIAMGQQMWLELANQASMKQMATMQTAPGGEGGPPAGPGGKDPRNPGASIGPAGGGSGIGSPANMTQMNMAGTPDAEIGARAFEMSGRQG